MSERMKKKDPDEEEKNSKIKTHRYGEEIDRHGGGVTVWGSRWRLATGEVGVE